MARQESRPKNRRKKAARQKTEVEGKVKATLSRWPGRRADQRTGGKRLPGKRLRLRG